MPQMTHIDLDARMLTIRLGVGDLYRASRGCWGFGACCDCEDCQQREWELENPEEAVERKKAVEQPRQPWELAA